MRFDRKRVPDKSQMADSQNSSCFFDDTSQHTLQRHQLTKYDLAELGVYVFQCSNRPHPDLCKPGFSTSFPHRFKGLCTQDEPTACIFLVCVNMELLIELSELQQDDYDAIRTQFMNLEAYILDKNKRESSSWYA